MCAIVGVTSSKYLTNRAWLAVGRDAMSHRGPDGFGEWWASNGLVGFGHRRLSIIDTSTAGAQPMHHSQTSNVIIFNGEIYNFESLKEDLESKGYRFNSRSDTEVLLLAYEEYGHKVLDKLEGMFAFAIYDSRHEKVFIARDRAGEKPLFYLYRDNELRFSSELKGLLVDAELPRTINQFSLRSYLSVGFISGEGCILDGFKKLPPGHALEFDLTTGKKVIWKYWSDSSFQFQKSGCYSIATHVNQLDLLLEDSVRKQMVADVPVGVLLSGGLDSSLIVAMASRVAHRVDTYTIRYTGHSEFDEGVHARLISNHFGTSHHELEVDGLDISILQELAHQFDEPIIDSSMVPTFIVSKLIRETSTVALGGDGADEIFGGYLHYSRLCTLNRYTNWMPYHVRNLISGALSEFMPPGARGKNWIEALGYKNGGHMPHIATYFDEKSIARLLDEKDIDGKRLISSYLHNSGGHSGDIVDIAMRTDFNNYLPEDILVKVDRCSMMNSLEIRSPFLSRGIMEYAFASIPPGLKASSGGRKKILTELGKSVLPASFNFRRKQGFSMPLSKWLSEKKYNDYFKSVLMDKDCIFDKRLVGQLFESHKSRINNSEKIFSLIMFEFWRKRFNISI